jgi:sugar lactone lactonase YvrE
MFTNPNGIATGIIGSLGYWLEQQGVRRGSQPQYYYQLIVMPIYEYLPIIGSVLAMFAGMVLFWNRRRDEIEANADEATLARRARMKELASEVGGTSGLTVIDAPDEPSGLFDENKPKKQAITIFEPLTPAHAEYNALAREERAAQAPFTLTRLSFVLFMAWMSVMNLIAFTLAGEKMPWLGTHLTVPMIIITAWYFGTVIEKIEWRAFVRRGWLLLVLLPLFFIVVFQALSPFLFGGQSFGLDQASLQRTMEFIGVLAVGALVAFFIWGVTAQTGIMHLRRMIGVALFALLSVLTLRSAWVAAFINYDFANEYLVYAHGAPGFRLMMEQIEDISQRTTNGMDIRFAWGGNAWPASWYFRELPNASFFGSNPTPQNFTDAVAVYASDDIRSRVEPLLEDRFVRFEYTRMWWPMQDYFNLTATRVVNALDFSPTNVQASQTRQGIWDIWWARDYRRYGEATGGSYSLTSWPVSEGMSFYVRRDVAAQIWNLGVGDTSVLDAGAVDEVNQCVANWQPTSAGVVFSVPPTALNKPVDIAIGADGRVFVADEFNNRVVVFDEEGRYLEEFTASGSTTGLFTRPNGVAVLPDGDLVVADTWNYRVEVLDDSGEPQRGWGQVGQFGVAAVTEPEDGLWGPRDVTTDLEGNIYVADTGNKRIRVYDAEGNLLRDIGSGGSDIGQLEEPAGLTIHSDGRLFVADTWNRRVSVFDIEGAPMYTFPVRGWYEDLGNRPYLAVDETRDRLYVSDPDAARVLVYDTRGNCIGSFGQAGDAPFAPNQFGTTGGVAVDEQGRVYVVDSRGNRVLRFPAFEVPVAPAAQG